MTELFGSTAAFFASPLHGALEILAAAGLDALIGEPSFLSAIHPVVLLGKYISWFEKKMRAWVQRNGPFRRNENERIAGRYLGISTVVLAAAAAWGLVALADWLNPWAGSAVRVVLLYFAFAGKCLAQEGSSVAKALENGDLPLAKERISRVVGRDTQKMTAIGVSRACVETIAENTTDGVVSPLFYAALGSLFSFAAPLVWAFKAASTLDSMVGYKNEKYLNLGRFSALQDDVFNFLPARITGALMVLGALILRLDWRNAGQTLARDHANHPSPNSGWAESAMAGALGVRLGGGAYYGGVWSPKPTIGTERKVVDAGDIRKAIRLMWITEALALLTCLWSPVAAAMAGGLLALLADRKVVR